MLNKSVIINSTIAYTIASIVFFYNYYAMESSNNIFHKIEDKNPIIKRVDPLNVIPNETKNDVIKEQQVRNILPYSQPNLMYAKNNGKVLIYFSSKTCSKCESFLKSLSAESLPKDVILLYADFNIDKSLVQKYNVQAADTIVQIDENQKEVLKWRSPDKLSIVENIK